MKRKQAGGRLPATAALHEEEAGSRQGGVLVQDVNHGAGGNGVVVTPRQLVSLPAVVLFSLDAKPGLGDGEPGLSVLRPERRKAERGASIRLLVVHSRGSPM